MRAGTRLDRPLWMRPGPVTLGEPGRHQQPPCPHVAPAVPRHEEAIALPRSGLDPPGDDLATVAGHLIAADLLERSIAAAGPNLDPDQESRASTWVPVPGVDASANRLPLDGAVMPARTWRLSRDVEEARR